MIDSKSDIWFMWQLLTSYDKANEVIEEIFESLLSRYQIVSKTLIKESNIVFNSIQLLYYKCHNINSKFAGSNI